MVGFVLRRLIEAVPTLLLVTLVVFGLMHIGPGDPVASMLGSDYSAEAGDALRRQLGLDQPLAAQYGSWLAHALTGDLGMSIRSKQPVGQMVAERLPVTVSLAVLSLVVALAIAIPVGAVSAARRNSRVDYVSMAATMLGLSIPNFVLGVLLILVFAVHLRLLPISGYVEWWSRPLEAWPYYVMPVVTLGAARAAVLARQVRSGMLEVLRRDYVRTAYAKGLPRQTVLLGHALRNALVPVITLSAISFGYLLGGSIVVEQIFGLPGLGSLLVSAVLARDFPVIQSVTLLMAIFFVLASLIADALYAIADPRLRRA
jgi:peptide/nickel transport system permease protein